MKYFFKLTPPQLCLILLCVFHLAMNLLWLSNNSAPLPWDQAGHTKLAVQFAEYFTGHLNTISNPLKISTYYPPLTHIVASLFILNFGFSVFSAAFTTTAYFILLLIGVFLLARELSRDEWTAFATVFILSFLPSVYETSRWLLLEIPLLTVLTYTYYFLFRSKYFSNKKYTIFFFAGCVAVLLTKWIGVVFLIVPTLFALAKRYKRGFSRQQVLYLVFGSLSTALLALPWYVSNYARLVEMGSIAAKGEITDPQSLLAIENLRFYLASFLNFQLTLWPALITLVVLGIFFVKKNQYKWLFGTFLLSNYLIFTIISNKDVRYTLPLLLPISFILGHQLITWVKKENYLGTLLLCLSTCWLVLQFFLLSFHALPLYQKAWNLGPLGWIDYINTGDVFVSHPKTDVTPNNTIIEYLIREIPTRKTVILAIDQPQTNLPTLDLLLVLKRNNIIRLEEPYETVAFTDEAAVAEYLARFDYYLVPEGEVGIDASRNKVALEQIKDYLLTQKSANYQKIAEFETDQPGGKLSLFKKI